MQQTLFAENSLTASEHRSFVALIYQTIDMLVCGTGATTRVSTKRLLMSLVREQSSPALARLRSSIPMQARYLEPRLEELLRDRAIYEPTWQNYEKWEAI